MECYTLTKVVDHRRPLLARTETAGIVTDSLEHLRRADRIKLFAFCVMPDHVHFACCLMPGEELSRVVASFSKFTALRINRSLAVTGSLWQEGFHDRRCRDREELAELCEYIEHNPVRAALVESASDWPYGSASPDFRDRLDREWWP